MTAAAAQDAGDGRDFSVSLAAYGWLLSLDGAAAIDGNAADVDVPFSTIIENLDGGVMAQVDLRYARFGAFVNGVYGRVTADERATSAGQTLSAGVETRITFLDFGVSYAFDPIPLAPSRGVAGPAVTLSPYVGGRFTNVDLELAVNGQRFAENITFTDPIIGLRSEWDFGPRWSAALRGDIGGFGVGSDFSWHILGAAGYRFGLLGDDDARAFLGYRVLGQDYADGSGDSLDAWDVITHGPFLGLQLTY